MMRLPNRSEVMKKIIPPLFVASLLMAWLPMSRAADDQPEMKYKGQGYGAIRKLGLDLQKALKPKNRDRSAPNVCRWSPT